MASTSKPTLSIRERIEREDLVMFINACFACTRQDEFYSDRLGQTVSIEFLHEYIRVNYRRLYARTLAAGINHFSQAAIVLNLLAAGAPRARDQRIEEGKLIAATLLRLPANRAFGILRTLAKRKINNRRTRAVVKRFLAARRDPTFDVVKYRTKYRTAAAHSHLKLDGEIGPFLFESNKKQGVFQTRLFETFRQARYSAKALYDLPFTVAEGLAERHGVPRDVFFKNIEKKMTAAERLRFQSAARRTKGAKLNVDLTRAPLTRLALYVLSLSRDERLQRRDELDEALRQAARRAIGVANVKLNRVAAVLDASYSASGSSAKRRRPLAVALAAGYLLSAAAREYRAFWTPPRDRAGNARADNELLVRACGQTALADPLLDALQWRPDLVVIVSDGFENDPPRAVAEVARVFRARIDPELSTEMIHMNPVFDAENYAPRPIGDAIPTVGLRDAEDIPTMLGFARFAIGNSRLAELESYLERRMSEMLKTP